MGTRRDRAVQAAIAHDAARHDPQKFTETLEELRAAAGEYLGRPDDDEPRRSGEGASSSLGSDDAGAPTGN